MKLSKESIKIGAKLNYCGTILTVIKYGHGNHRGKLQYRVYCVDENGYKISFELFGLIRYYHNVIIIFPKYSLLQKVKI